ncbi:MAG: aldo/keto reductase [Alphaproteobacteria bacterium]|nr:aldo/keto reductase [Alphaproteobacteria bacterium]MDE2492491.1 aldo/keto reductase [Alphaproteobacteria bacterium]
MKQRKFGKTGFEVSEVGHGLWGMGSWSDADDDISRAALRSSIMGGCTFFDSAFVYGNGRSDNLIGGVSREYPQCSLVLASKIPPADGRWPSSPKNPLRAVFPRVHVMEYAERIRRAFGRTVDLLQFHVWEDAWAEEAEWQDTVAELKAKGLIKAFGLSLNRWQPENGIAAIETGLVESVQVIYNIFDQSPEDYLFPVCRKYKVGVIARVPLDEGSLGGKLTLETRFPDNDWRARYFSSRNLAETVARVAELRKILPVGMSLPEMALRFILSEPTVSTLIAGMRSQDHVCMNLAASDKGSLPIDLIAKLREHRWDRKPSA